MEFEAVIKKRRSVRKYLHIPVPRELITRILEVGHEAPCAGNVANWRFIIVQDETAKKELAEAALEQYWIAEAPVIIVVCSTRDEIGKFYGSRGEKLYCIQNCAAAVENMLLQAVNLGLSSCWVGAFDENEVQRALSIPEDIRPQAILPIGYPAEENPRPMRFRLEDVTYFNNWGNQMEFKEAYLRDYKLAEKVRDKAKNWLQKVKDIFIIRE